MKKVCSACLVLLVFVMCLSPAVNAKDNGLNEEIINFNEQVNSIFDPKNEGSEKEYAFIAPEDGYVIVDYSVDLEGAIWSEDSIFNAIMIKLDKPNYNVYINFLRLHYENTQQRTHRIGVSKGERYTFAMSDSPENTLQSAVNYSLTISFTAHDAWIQEPHSNYTYAQPIELNNPIYGELNYIGYDLVWTVLDIEEDTEVCMSLQWPEGINEDVDIDFVDPLMCRLLFVYHEMETPEEYEYPQVKFGEGETLTLKKGRNYILLYFYDWMLGATEYDFEPGIYQFTVTEVNPDIAFTAQGYSDGLIYDVTVEGSIPNQYPDGITSLTNSEIQSLPVTIHTRNLLNGAVREMGPSTIEMFKVTTVNGKIESIEIRGRAQTNPGTFDRYTVIYTVT